MDCGHEQRSAVDDGGDMASSVVYRGHCGREFQAGRIESEGKLCARSLIGKHLG